MLSTEKQKSIRYDEENLKLLREDIDITLHYSSEKIESIKNLLCQHYITNRILSIDKCDKGVTVNYLSSNTDVNPKPYDRDEIDRVLNINSKNSYELIKRNLIHLENGMKKSKIFDVKIYIETDIQKDGFFIGSMDMPIAQAADVMEKIENHELFNDVCFFIAITHKTIEQQINNQHDQDIVLH